MLSSAETLDARHPHISQGWKRPFCQCRNISFLSLDNPEKQKCSGEKNVMRGYPKTGCTTGLDLESTATYDNSKEVSDCTRLFSEAMGFLSLAWPEPLSALIPPGRLFPCVPLTEMQGLAPDINLAQLQLFPHLAMEGYRGVGSGSKCFLYAE